MQLIDRLVILGVVLWVGGMLVGRTIEALTPPPHFEAGYPIETLPRGPADDDGLRGPFLGRTHLVRGSHSRRGQTRTGTAWQAGAGLWLTARHVVENCHLTRLGPVGRPEVARLWRHPAADLAVVESVHLPRTVLLAEAPPRAGAAGYAVGYPRGRPAVAELTLVAAGQARLSRGLRTDPRFRILWWQVRSLPDPDHLWGFGGMSGGVVLNKTGHAVGVIFASSARRARVMSIPHGDLRRALEATDARPFPPADGDGPIEDVVAYGGSLLRDDTVARVYCST
jgi:serine protease Do